MRRTRLVRPSRESRLAARWAVTVWASLALAGCAATHHPRGPVLVDSRPTPPPPQEGSGARPGTSEAPTRTATEADSRKSAERSRLAADTLAVKAAVARCARHRLLPEQESTIDATLRLLGEARLAIADGDMARAASLAREARQLSTSLGCP